MAGSETLHRQGGRFAAAFAVSFLKFAGAAHAQSPLPPRPPAATPARSFADVVEIEDPPVALGIPATAPGPSYYPGVAPAAPRVVMGPFDTIFESICGKPDQDTDDGPRRSSPLPKHNRAVNGQRRVSGKEKVVRRAVRHEQGRHARFPPDHPLRYR
jgi:hypothetical protein